MFQFLFSLNEERMCIFVSADVLCMLAKFFSVSSLDKTIDQRGDLSGWNLCEMLFLYSIRPFRRLHSIDRYNW